VVVEEGEAEGVCPLLLLTLFDALFPWEEKHGKQLILSPCVSSMNSERKPKINSAPRTEIKK